jgi:hypothetical protein
VALDVLLDGMADVRYPASHAHLRDAPFQRFLRDPEQPLRLLADPSRPTGTVTAESP